MVIPTFNRCDLLERTLAGLAEQTLPTDRFEVIVADDGSSDGTYDVVRSFEPTLPIRYYHQPDRGFDVGGARNAGARLADAPLLTFIDTGVVPGPGFLAAHLAAHQAAPPVNHADGVPETAGPVVLGYTYGYTPIAGPHPGLADLMATTAPADIVRAIGDAETFRDMRHAELAADDFDLSRLAAPWMYCWTMNLSVRTADFHAVGGFDPDFTTWGCEDLELGYRLSASGARFLMERQAWAIETPHDRDLAGNLVTSTANASLFLRKRRVPAVEIFWGHFRKLVRVEDAIQDLLAWQRKVSDHDVRAELAAVAERFPDVTRAAGRTAVLGCGPGLPPGWAPSHILDFDEELLGHAAAEGGHTAHHCLGLNTLLPEGSVDVVVVTSRLAGLWAMWGELILDEAHRIGTRVHVTFLAPGTTA